MVEKSKDGPLTQSFWQRESGSSPNMDGFPKKMRLGAVSCTARQLVANNVANYHGKGRVRDSDFLNYVLTFSYLSDTAGKPAIGGPWSLIDLDGNLVTNKNFEGKWLLLYFGFARCPDICPSEMVKVGKVMDTLIKDYPNLAKKIQPIFVSVDPARDSLKALREYGKDFHPSYVFLTGSPEQVQQMAKKYRVYVSKADETEDGDYLVDHSIVIYFHDDTGDLADCFTQSMRPKDIVEKINERMNFVPTY